MTNSKLSDYAKKRDFEKTPEPAGEPAAAAPPADAPIFVVQKHDASRLHYDFRLQIGDTMPSWAVPKGPSMNPADKRLAVHVEDHPIDYASFEGTIPEAEYGGGTVMVWDFGTVTFKAEGKTPQEWLDEGLLEFELHGQKLKGKWKLIHTKMGGSDKNWLLMKRKDEFATDRDILKDEPNSAKTGRTLEEIAKGSET
ncbi:MAG: DNA polymerase ligase N-terminal domain-containing protein [Phycisphaerae bacterium]|nr:DNA polymerase ligase N-terminal domain-containing protein [Phycisphaerae bacterium]